ncbi:MAG: NADH-quinone oxidoreductase subunit C, partial [Actinomycetota bacterium]
MPDETPADEEPTEEPPRSERPEGPAPGTPAPEASEAIEEATDAEPAHLSDTEAKILGRLGRELGDDILESASAFGTLVVRVKPDAWRRAAEVTKTDLQCDYLSFIAGIDWQPAPREGGEVAGASSAPVQPTEMTFGAAGSAGRFQLLAVVESTSHKWGVTLKTDVHEAAPRAESWGAGYAGAGGAARGWWGVLGGSFAGDPSQPPPYLPAGGGGPPRR